MELQDQIRVICSNIVEGLTEQESCLLAGLNYDDFEQYKNRDPALTTLIEKKKVEFKKRHLEIINQREDPKNSAWLLERVLPDQFGSKKPQAAPPNNNLAVFIQQIQENGNNTKMIPMKSKKDKSKNKKVVYEVKDALN